MTIFKKNKTFIIAEAGVNHNGDKGIAKKLIDAALFCGADAIKFQSFKAKRVISKYSQKAPYQQKNKHDLESQLSMLEKLELSTEDLTSLYHYAQKKGIHLFSTPKDIVSARELYKLGLPIFKIGSTEINNFELLEYVASFNKPLIVSTGMSTLAEVAEAVQIIQLNSTAPLILLHCVSQYPCPTDQVNLKAMATLHHAFYLPVGYSDHTLGFEIALAATALGAKVIEKHFTLDKKMAGPDHKISLEPKEFKSMVKSIRNIEKSLGNGIKKPLPCEIENRQFLRRSLTFTKDLKKGSKITSKDITIKRPGTGLEPKYKHFVINRVLKQNISQDEPVTLDSIQT